MRLALRIVRKLAVGCLALIGGFTALGWFFTWLDWPIRHQPLPSVADRMILQTSQMKPTGDGPEWTRRLRGRYEHSSLSEMVAALQAEGFSIYAKDQMATLHYDYFPCGLNFQVFWDATDDNTLRGLRGDIWCVCL